MKRDSLSNLTYRKARHHASLHEQNDFELGAHAEPIACSACGAVCSDGKWQWAEAALKEMPVTHCPSCTRVFQKKPAGYVMLQGDFALDHRNEMLALIRYIETRENMQDPLKRIMWIDYQEEGVTVTTANNQLTHIIGEALQRAYKGELDYHFNELEESMILRWKK